MNGSVVNVNNHKAVILDNFYEKNEYDDIMDECLFLSKRNKLSPLGGAKKNGVELKKNNGVWLDNTFIDRNNSDILYHNRKIFNPTILNELKKIDSIYNYMELINVDYTLLSYYETGDHYLSHQDNAVITVLSWFYKEPKNFKGGDIIFEKETSNVFVECKNNRVVFFPSFLHHEVTEVDMPKNKIGFGYGRFATSQFLSIK